MATRPRDAEAEIAPDLITGRRGAARARLHVNALLETTTGELPVLLRDLSCSGARVEGEKLPALGRTALLKRGRLEALGIVVWHDGEGRCGLHFFDPLNIEEVIAEAQQPPEPARRPAQYYWKPTGASDVITAEDWQQARARAERQRRSMRGFS